MGEPITLTQEELDKKIKEEVSKAVTETTAKLTSEHNDQMAQLRKENKEKLENAVAKAKEEANLSAEELAKKKIEEEQKSMQEELNQLRYEKKVNDRTKKLADAQVPLIFAHDTRLLNAEDDKVDEVIGVIKKEYEETLPKNSGSTTSTNVGGGGKTQTDKFADMRNAGFSK